MPKAKKEGPSWRTVMRRSKTVTSEKEAKKLREQAHAMRREERAAAAGKTIERIDASVPTKSPKEMMSREARHLPPNTLMGEDSAANEEPITPFAAAMTAIAKLAGKDNLEAFHDILRDFAIYHRNDMERDHVDTLRKVHEANAANVVRSYMALIDGLGHANGGPVPPYVVIPGLMAVRVYDALRLAGHSPD